MSKIKLKRHSPRVDMTPMVDLFSLLLTFFMLTTTFRPQEAVEIGNPYSVSEKESPEKNVITLVIDSAGRVFFNMDNGPDTSFHYRKDLIEEVAKYKNLNLNNEQITLFEKSASFGMPFKDLGSWLNEEDAATKKSYQTGIPMDSADNQLGVWVRYARLTNQMAEVSIKGDTAASYKAVKRVIDILQENKVNKFNLVTFLVKEEAILEE